MVVRRLTRFLTCALLAAIGAAAVAAARPNLAQTARLLVAGTNEFRHAEGAGRTEPDAKLSAAAQRFADYMARTDRYGHEADGREPTARAQEQGYAFCLIAENIAFAMSSSGFTTQDLAERVLRGWKESPGHRHNLLNAEATDIGIALAHSAASDRYYAVQMFGRPRSKAIEFNIANRSPAALQYAVDGQSYRLPPRSSRTHQQCGMARVALQLPGQSRPTSLSAGGGERYVVELDATKRYVVKKGAS